jgi:putative FmdB family regulatory protein
MPIYEYECLECGIRFEKLQRFGDPDPDACPKGHRGVHRLLSQPAIIFKGSGFYVTDHGRNGHRSSRKGRPKKESEASSSTKEEAQHPS